MCSTTGPVPANTGTAAVPSAVVTEVEVVEEEKEATDEDPREHLNLVFIGHGGYACVCSLCIGVVGCNVAAVFIQLFFCTLTIFIIVTDS